MSTTIDDDGRNNRDEQLIEYQPKPDNQSRIKIACFKIVIRIFLHGFVIRSQNQARSSDNDISCFIIFGLICFSCLGDDSSLRYSLLARNEYDLQ